MKKLFALAVVLLVAVSLVGCNRDDDHDDDDSTHVTPSLTQSEAKDLVIKDAGISKEDIVYYSCVNDGDEYEIVFDTDNTEYKYNVSFKNGNITKRSHKTHEDTRNPSGTRDMSEDELKKIAFAKANVQESDITNYQYDIDEDSNSVEIDFDYQNKEYSIEIDRTSGNIIEYDIDIND